MKPVKEILPTAGKERASKTPVMTGRDLLDSGLIGLWSGRRDAKSPSFARKLRARASRRGKAS